MKSNIYEIAEKSNIPIVYMQSRCSIALSVRLAKGNYIIGIDPGKVDNPIEEHAIIAHELSHCITDSFYNTKTPLNTRGRMEYRANCKMVTLLVPPETILNAIKAGYTEVWEIAEYLNMPEWVINTAIFIYRRKGLIA